MLTHALQLYYTYVSPAVSHAHALGCSLTTGNPSNAFSETLLNAFSNFIVLALTEKMAHCPEKSLIFLFCITYIQLQQNRPPPP
mmetsp:Transcript_20418/g.34027  ORF Transcript_20418/g.34027 Transcript_20418/m.34027 type:complete len:84 (+) Transcript_20418:221-472(+)